MIAGGRIFLAEFPVDLRFGLARLMGLAFEAGLNPRQGDVVVFGGRNRKRLKVLHGDATGVWLSTKTFMDEDARARIDFLDRASVRGITPAELAWLVDGRKEKK